MTIEELGHNIFALEERAVQLEEWRLGLMKDSQAWWCSRPARESMVHAAALIARDLVEVRKELSDARFQIALMKSSWSKSQVEQAAIQIAKDVERDVLGELSVDIDISDFDKPKKRKHGKRFTKAERGAIFDFYHNMTLSELRLRYTAAWRAMDTLKQFDPQPTPSPTRSKP